MKKQKPRKPRRKKLSASPHRKGKGWSEFITQVMSGHNAAKTGGGRSRCTPPPTPPVSRNRTGRIKRTSDPKCPGAKKGRGFRSAPPFSNSNRHKADFFAEEGGGERAVKGSPSKGRGFGPMFHMEHLGIHLYSFCFESQGKAGLFPDAKLVKDILEGLGRQVPAADASHGQGGFLQFLRP